MIRGAIFDADGTLLDSMKIWRELGKRYLRSVGKTPEPGLSEILYPMSLEESDRYLKAHYALPESLAQIHADVLRMIADFYRSEVTLKPGVLAFVEQLDRRGIPMVIATATDSALLEEVLERLGLRRYFREIFTCSALETNKRDPLIYQTAARYLNLTPGDVFVFEDVLHAIVTAGGAGFTTVAVEDFSSAGDREKMRRRADYWMADFLHFDEFWKFATGV